MKKTIEIKLMIIENFIDHFTSSEAERDEMKEVARIYVEEDHVDEIEQSIGEIFGQTIDVKIEELRKRMDKAIAKKIKSLITKKSNQKLIDKVIERIKADVRIGC